MASDNVNQELLQIFIEEATDLGDALSTTLREWEAELNNLSKIADLKRDLHTLKGSARMVGLSSIGTLAHELETLCEALASGKIKINRSVFDLINLSQDRISLMIEALKKNEKPNDIEDIIEQFHHYLPKTEEAVTPLPITPKSAEEKKLPVSRHASPEVLRVSAEVLESLNSLSTQNSMLRANLEEQIVTYGASLQEMKMGTQRIEDQIEMLNAELEELTLSEYDQFSPLENLGARIKETATDLADALKVLTNIHSTTESLLINYTRISTEFQYRLSSIRLVPFASVVPRLSRIARQICGELKKEIDFTVTQSEGEMDRKVLEHLVPSLEHILRNAIDHGIESAVERHKVGKPERGKIEVSFTRTGSMVAIEIKDDGAGIDSNTVRKKAIKMGLLPPDTTISDEEVIRFILEPGFSTREAVTEVSGRGVGMDVVNMAVKEMGGNLTMVSERGAGTRMIVRFPFTISLNRVLLLSVQEQHFGMLLANIENVVSIPVEKLTDSTLEYEGKPYSLHYLGCLLETDKKVARYPRKKMFPVILFSGTDCSIALVVDEILYNRELVVQALTGQLKLTNLCNGATLLGDGEVVFILDPYHLSLKAKSMQAKEKLPIEFSDVKNVNSTEKQLIMVVDDSVSARTVTKDFLKRYNYQIITAKDGADALELLETNHPALILLDIDMPRMDGFEFSIAAGKDKRLQNIPIIIVTSRSNEHKKRAEELKLYNILEKPYQETKLLSTIWSLLGKKP